MTWDHLCAKPFIESVHEFTSENELKLMTDKVSKYLGLQAQKSQDLLYLSHLASSNNREEREKAALLIAYNYVHSIAV